MAFKAFSLVTGSLILAMSSAAFALTDSQVSTLNTTEQCFLVSRPTDLAFTENHYSFAGDENPAQSAWNLSVEYWPVTVGDLITMRGGIQNKSHAAVINGAGIIEREEDIEDGYEDASVAPFVAIHTISGYEKYPYEFDLQQDGEPYTVKRVQGISTDGERRVMHRADQYLTAERVGMFCSQSVDDMYYGFFTKSSAYARAASPALAALSLLPFSPTSLSKHPSLKPVCGMKLSGKPLIRITAQDVLKNIAYLSRSKIPAHRKYLQEIFRFLKARNVKL